MGLDIWLTKPGCKSCGRGSDRLCEIAYTYNVSPMWYKIYPEDKGIVYIDGMKGKDALPKLMHAINDLMKNPEYFEKLNPPNGHGNYKGFTDFISLLIDYCREYPELIWESCR